MVQSVPPSVGLTIRGAAVLSSGAQSKAYILIDLLGSLEKQKRHQAYPESYENPEHPDPSLPRRMASREAVILYSVKNPMREHGASSMEKAIYICGLIAPKPTWPFIPSL
jgi:hypothetical protein